MNMAVRTLCAAAVIAAIMSIVFLIFVFDSSGFRPENVSEYQADIGWSYTLFTYSWVMLIYAMYLCLAGTSVWGLVKIDDDNVARFVMIMFLPAMCWLPVSQALGVSFGEEWFVSGPDGVERAMFYYEATLRLRYWVSAFIALVIGLGLLLVRRRLRKYHETATAMSKKPAYAKWC